MDADHAGASPKRFPDRDEIAAVLAECEPLEAGGELAANRRLAGRAMARRGMGKLVFVDLVDRSGRMQLICDTSKTGELDIHLGDVIGVVGRPGKSKRGEPSLLADSVEVLSRNTQPLPDTFHGLTDVELRYRKRFLDLLMNEETRADFVIRARIVTAVRRHLDADGFVEVETPVLQPRYGGAFARPFVTHHNELDADLYLRIATELYLKRLIVGGLERVYELGKDFRNEGVSFKHNPEFTMLEWYEAYADYRDTMARVEQLVERVAREVLGTTAVSFRGHEIELAAPWQRIGFVESLEAKELWTRDPVELRAWLTERGIDTKADKDWSQLIDHAFSHFVEPGLIQPTIVYDYPVELSPFARTTDADPLIVERFEYFAGGMELGNAFSEINTADEQAARFAMQAAQVEGEPGDPDYVEALSYGMPPTGGLGLGIDRLTMLLTGRETIRDVVLFPALSEGTKLTEIVLPNRWGYADNFSLMFPDWWDTELVPHAQELLRDWSALRWARAHELALAEGQFLSGRLFGPYPPKWELRRIVPVGVTARRTLEAFVARGDTIQLLEELAPETVMGQGMSSSRFEVLIPYAAGLALLAAMRAGLSPTGRSIQEAYLDRVEPAWRDRIDVDQFRGD